jgi:hypothetical protein
MEPSTDQSATHVRRTLECEMTLVREAIAMVASGGSRRVVVGGLRFGEALIVPARGLATEAGVRLVPLWMPDDAGADIAVEWIDDE